MELGLEKSASLMTPKKKQSHLKHIPNNVQVLDGLVDEVQVLLINAVGASSDPMKSTVSTKSLSSTNSDHFEVEHEAVEVIDLWTPSASPHESSSLSNGSSLSNMSRLGSG